jgi:hypothetical protein
MAQVKGLAVKARIDYLHKQFGAAGLQRVLDGLSAEHRALIDEGVLVSSWYPLALSDALLGTAERLLGRGDGSLCREIGMASGRSGLAGAHRRFAERLDPLQIGAKMEHSTRLLWQSYYDKGSMLTRATGPLAIETELAGIELRQPWLCHVLTGYITAHIEVLGGHGVRVTHGECRVRAQPRCIWSASWTA